MTHRHAARLLAAAILLATGAACRGEPVRPGPREATVRVDTLPVELRALPGAFDLYQNGGRRVAVWEAQEYNNAHSDLLEFDGSRWTVQRQRTSYTPVVRTALYVDPRGTAYAVQGGVLMVSERPGEWVRHPAVQAATTVTGWGERTLAFAAVGGAWKFVHLTARSAADAGIPNPFPTVKAAVAGGSELYASSGAGVGPTAYWNGASWVPVTGEEGPVSLSLLAAPPAGGSSVYGAAGSALYQLREGRATRVPNPLAERGEAVTRLAVDREGNPYLGHFGGVVWRTPSGWREHVVVEPWRALPGVWPDADGSVWVVAGRPSGVVSRAVELLDVYFLRLRSSAP